MKKPSAFFLLPLAYIPPVIIVLSILRSMPSATAISFLVAMFVLYGLICFKAVVGLPKRFQNRGMDQLAKGASSLLVSLGIAGTFIGIVMGLGEFNVKNIGNSVPALLEGLKTAFITSVFGILLSIFLKLITSLTAIGRPDEEPGKAAVEPEKEETNKTTALTPLQQLHQKLERQQSLATTLESPSLPEPKPDMAKPEIEQTDMSLDPIVDDQQESGGENWSFDENEQFSSSLESVNHEELMEMMRLLQNSVDRLCSIQELHLKILQMMDKRLQAITPKDTARTQQALPVIDGDSHEF